MTDLKPPKRWLLATFGGVSLGILLSFLPLSQPKIDFPDRVSLELTQGQLASIKSESLPVPKSLEAIARRYSFSNFKIDSYYITNRASGDLPGLLKQVNDLTIPATKWKTKESSGKGYYAIFNHNGQAYLSSCINPQGDTTVDAGQFQRNRNRYNLNPSRFAFYALGLTDLRDKRCLWVTISTPERSGADLEKIWLEWLDYWQPRFPKYFI
jgi:cyanosortase A-associated protein